MGGEVWRDIPGYDGIYQVSDHGRVKSLDRIIHSKTGPRKHRGRIMKFSEGPGGRWQVMLCSAEGEKKQKRVHRLVLEAFVGPCPEGMECCHWDDNSKNNHLSNLRWDSRSANHHDSVRNGSHPNAAKTHCPQGHTLEAPNLEKWNKENGYRKCLACDRARGKIQYRPDLRGDFKRLQIHTLKKSSEVNKEMNIENEQSTLGRSRNSQTTWTRQLRTP